jgi:Ner family transcriptional regulator
MSNAHPQDVMSAVRKTGTTLSAMSRAIGLHHGVLRVALTVRQPRYNKIIADHLGTTVHALWPDWFHEDGTSRKMGPNPLRQHAAAEKSAA